MPNAGARILAADNARWFCKSTQGTGQALAAATFTALTFGSADDVDNLGIHDPTTNSTRFNLGAALGWWLLVGTFATPGTAVAGGRRMRWVMNGASGVNGGYVAFPSITPTGGFWSAQSTALVQATASADYVELQAYSDAALTTTVSGDLRSAVTCIYQGS